MKSLENSCAEYKMNTVYTQVEGEDWETMKEKSCLFHSSTAHPSPPPHTKGDEKLCNCVRKGLEKPVLAVDVEGQTSPAKYCYLVM